MKKLNSYLLTFLMALFMTIGTSSASGQSLMSTRVIGEGQPMILIHGMSCSDKVWDEVVDRYKGQFELHLVTLAGFGNEDTAEKTHYLEAVKDELITYTKSKNLNGAILMGHSMGGFLSYWAAADEPDLFGRVVAIDGLPYFPAMQGPGITPETSKPMAESMRKSMSQMDGEMYKNFQVQTIAGMITEAEKREKVLEMSLASNKALLGQAFGEMYTTDLRPVVKDIKIPVLVLGSWYGYKDYGVTREMVQRGIEGQVATIENAKVEVADKALHFIFYDEPNWFYEQVEGFLGIEI